MYHVVHNTCSTHGRNIKTRYIGSDVNLAIRKGLTFYQTRSNTIILQGTLPAYCIPKVVRLKTGEVFFLKKHTCYLDHHQRSHYVTIGLKNWARKLFNNQKGKLFNSQKGEVARQAKFFQPTQPIRSEQPDITQDVIVLQNERKTSRSQEISVNSFNEELCSSDRSGQPDITPRRDQCSNTFICRQQESQC